MRTRIIFLILFIPLLQVQVFAQGKAKHTFHTLAGRLSDDTNAQEAIKQLIDDADVALRMKAFAVTDKDPLPPSRRKNDYYSWAPYLWPNPNTKDGYPYIGKDGQTNPETEARSDKPLLRRMAVAVHTLALAYYYTNDIKYANKSISFIRTWFLDATTKMNPNLDYGQCTPGIEKGTATGIIDSRWFILVIEAAGLLKQSAAFNEKDEAGLKHWFKNYLDWLLTSEIGRKEGEQKNNHGTWYAAQTASYALFVGDLNLAKKIVRSSRRFFDTQIDSAGRQVFELTRTKSYDYSLYNVHSLIVIAVIGNRVTVDLWHYNTEKGNNRNLQKSIEYLGGFSPSDKTWPYKQIAEKAICLTYGYGDHFSVYYPYDMYAALRIAYKIYKDPELLEQINKLPQENLKKNRSNLLVALAPR
jgi:hypothetical protein